MDKNCHEILEQKMCKELEMIEAKYAQNQSIEMSMQDLEKIDKLYHALKSMATYSAMKEAEEYEMDGYSGRRGCSPSTGRYVSRDGGSSYADGYSQGYSEAMNQMGNSGHRPMANGYPPVRW